MSWRNANLLAAAAAALALAAPAMAQNVCAERSRVVDQFRSEFNESPAAVGLVSEDTLLEVLTSEKGTWTIIITRPDGASCLVASGVAWQSVGSKASQRVPGGAVPWASPRKHLIAAEAGPSID